MQLSTRFSGGFKVSGEAILLLFLILVSANSGVRSEKMKGSDEGVPGANRTVSRTLSDIERTEDMLSSVLSMSSALNYG